VRKVNVGAELVNRTTAEFSGVSNMVGKAGQLVAEIAVASNEQSDGLRQLNSAVSSVDEVVQRNAASAEETAAAAEDMNNQASRMQEFIAELSSVIGEGDARENAGKKPAGETKKTRPAQAHTPRPSAPRLPAKGAPGRTTTGAAPGRTALPARKGPTKEVRPEEVIPFDDDFDQF
jgi:methyl-accepting chemotaxis protein